MKKVKKMAILKSEEIRDMKTKEIRNKLEELQTELMKVETTIGSGGVPENPGRVKELKRTIARVKTILKEKKGSKEK